MTANEAKINSLKKAIVSLDKNESYLLTISDRAKAAISLQKEKKPFLKSISDLESVLTTGFNLTSLEFGSSGELKLTATCDDRESLANFNDRIEQATQQGLFSKAVFSSIGRNKQGRYDFSLELKK